MLTAVAAAFLATCVPMRWISPEPASLRLLDGSPVSCLLLDPDHANRPLIDAAHRRGLKIIGVDVPTVPIVMRRELRLDGDDPVIATSQGVWPGIRVESPGPKSSAPTGAIWINTNTGVLRFLRSASKSAVWLANTPPEGTRYAATDYGHAIADAASVGARWVLTLDRTFVRELLKSDNAALADWKQIQTYLRFYEDHKEWREWRPYAELALVQDASSGALVTGNLLDMLSVMNTPVRAIPARELSEAKLRGAKLTVTIQPQDYTPRQRELIASFAEHGGKVVKGPEGFRMPVMDGDRITFSKEDYHRLEAIWPELHLAVQRKNFGVRMFNVNGTLSYLESSPDGKRALLHLVNFTDYPVESITGFVQGKYKRARYYTPEGPPRDLMIYNAPDGTAVEVDRLGVCGAVVLE